MSVTIYHNPRCSKSRQTLALLEDRGVKPQIVHYLDNPPSVAELTAIIAKLGVGARGIIRTGEAAYKELGLGDISKPDTVVIKAMVDNPILIERPIVVNGAKAAIGRPPNAVLSIL
jgi:arsenate reductase (glutaredoxin)